jgi:hypothetical protein
MGRPSRTYISRPTHTLYKIRWRLIVVLFIAAIFQQQYLFIVHRHSLADKYSSTNFDGVQEESRSRLLIADDEDAHFQEDLIANRASWKILGEGWEGKVFVYEDSVIKTFTPGRSPFRNCAPGTSQERWPTEIAASLRFGGIDPNFSHGSFSYSPDSNDTLEGFLPVRAYFKAAASSSQAPEWHLVTPLLKSGNIEKLAKTLAHDPNASTLREVDVRYRPAFERLLSNMQRLHDAGYCHDDIKPANIFIADDGKWMLGDLGNLRQIAHPYHSSRLWVDNEQLRDCRANDVMRLLKSYLKFVQMSASNPQQFNDEFFEGNEPLSRLFWLASADLSMSAARLRERSLLAHPGSGTNDKSSRITQTQYLSNSFSRRLTLQHAVNHALQTRMGEKLARWWAMTWIFKIPISDSCRV